MKVFISVALVAIASAQLPPMLNNYMPYGALPIVPGPPMVSRNTLRSAIVSGPSIVSESLQPIDIRSDSCALRCVRQCQNDQGSSSISNLRPITMSSFLPPQGSGSTAYTNIGLNTDFSSGISSETSRLTLSPSSSKSSSSVGQVAVKG